MKRALQTLANSDPWLLGLVVLLLAGAGACRLFMRQADPLPKDKIVLTVAKAGSKRDRDELRELISAFTAKHPDIYPQVIASNLERKADTMIAAGTPPDVVFLGCDRVNSFIESGALLDLTPFVEADPELRAALFGGPNGEPPDFYGPCVQPLMRDGKLYVLPVNYTPFLIFYSKDLFDKYHVPYPDENWDWDGLRERALALTRDRHGRRPDQPDFDKNNVVTYGFHYAKWQHGPETFIRQNGGRLVNEEGTQVVADDPKTVAALQFLYDLKHKYHVCPPGLVPRNQNIDMGKGTLGMMLYGVFMIPRLREDAPNLAWDVAPPPRGPAGRRASVVFTNTWAIPKGCKDPHAAFQLLKFLVSLEGMKISGKYQTFLPARRSLLRETFYADLRREGRNADALTHDVDHGYGGPPFTTRQHYMDVYDAINDQLETLLALQNPPYDPREACERMTREGNSILHRDRTVRASTKFGLFAAGVAALPGIYLLARFLFRRRAALSPLARSEERWGYLLVSPWIAGFLLFSAGPILASLLLSFAQWQSLSNFTRSEFVGLENYRIALGGEDPKFWPAMWVTFRYALVAVPLGLVAGLALALLMNQRVRGITIFRTLYYVPAVLPAVATAVLWYHLFDAHHGWVNWILEFVNVGGWLQVVAANMGETFPFVWTESPRLVPWLFVLLSLWTVGGGMIIYLAGLQNIPTELYEAAEIDGAGRWRKVRHVTLPMLSSVIFFNLVMGLIGALQVFGVAFVLFDTHTGPADSALFYGLHLFREAFFKYRLGYASALAWILFAIILALTALVMKSSPLWVHYEAVRRRRA